MKWITREHPKIDRIACPWLIKRLVDKEAEIIYVPFDEKKYYTRNFLMEGKPQIEGEVIYVIAQSCENWSKL
jgi:hypothetical protein